MCTKYIIEKMLVSYENCYEKNLTKYGILDSLDDTSKVYQKKQILEGFDLIK